MAVTLSAPLPRREGGKAADHTRTYRRSYRARSTAGESEAEVLDAVVVALGDVGSAHPDDASASVQSIQVSCQSRDGTDWSVEVEYGPIRPGESSPLLEEPEVDWGLAAYQRIADADRDGNPIVNSAGDPYDPPLTRDDSRPLLTIVRNEATYSPLLADAYRDTVNLATFFGAPAGTVKCKSITAKRAWSPLVAGGFYWVVTYLFEFNRDGWTSRPLDIGYRRLDGANRRQILIDGQPATSPVPLDGAGGVLTPGDPPVFLAFELYPEADYAAFGFPGA